MKEEELENELSMQEVYEGIDYDLNTYITEQGGECLTVIEEGFSNGCTLSAIDEFTRRIESAEELGYNVIQNARGTTVKELALAKYYRQVRSWIDTLFQYSPNAFFNPPNAYYANFPVFRFSPEVQAFFDACKELNLLKESFRNPADAYQPGVTYAELYNSLIVRIREKTKSADFSKKVKARLNNARRNQKSYSTYFSAALRKWSRLLVLRLDFYFPHSQTEQITAGEAHKVRKRFLNNMRHNELFDDLCALIWKLEYARDRGHHFHFIFLFNGRTRRQDEWIADKIGSLWVSKYTAGAGTFNNCNRHLNKYKRRGIGMIGHDDVLMREIFVRDVLGYLTKHDQYLLVKPNKGKTIGRKEMPRVRTSAVGRPRKVAPRGHSGITRNARNIPLSHQQARTTNIGQVGTFDNNKTSSNGEAQWMQ